MTGEVFRGQECLTLPSSSARYLQIAYYRSYTLELKILQGTICPLDYWLLLPLLIKVRGFKIDKLSKMILGHNYIFVLSVRLGLKIS